MPESPRAYRQRYLPISFDGVLGRNRIRLSKYRSSFHDNQFRKNALKDLRDFIRKRGRFSGGKNGASHDWDPATQTMKSDLLSPTNTVQVDTAILRGMFQGVGRPKDFENVLRAVDVYLTRVEMGSYMLSAMGWDYIPWSVQDYADWYLGLDCRGFVGAYLRENFPHIRDTAKDMSFAIDDYNKGPASFHVNKKGGNWTRIDDPKEIRAHDVLVKCNNGDGKRHVAIIHSTGGLTSMGIQVTTAESRGGKGLCELTDELRRLKTKHQDGPNDRNWSHSGAHYNFVLRPNP